MGGGKGKDFETFSLCRHKKSARFVPSEELFLDTPPFQKRDDPNDDVLVASSFATDRRVFFSGDDGRASFFSESEREREKERARE